jgi:uncharacterized protein YcbX
MTTSSTTRDQEGGRIIGLYRHAVKGLSADALQKVTLQRGDTFPDDRRYALMKQNTSGELFDPDNPQWLHKENFLCAFSNPRLMSKYTSFYDDRDKTLTLYGRNNDKEPTATNQTPLLDSVDLSTMHGRKQLANFFEVQSGTPLTCVTASVKEGDTSGSHHRHQFGNTSKNWKLNKDTRTMHIINARTVQQFSDTIGVPLNPTRFRPNIVIDNIEPWTEFDWIDDGEENGPIIQIGTTTLKAISKTVRCEGVSIDPLDLKNVLNIPQLLAKHFPQHGPYLGIYAIVEDGGDISVDDSVKVLDRSAQ